MTYMIAYFSNSESEVSELMKQNAKEIKNHNLNVREAMNKIAYSFTCNEHFYKQRQAEIDKRLSKS